MRPRWAKVLADLWENRARTLLVVASIAVGTFAVGVIAGAYVMIPQDMNASYAASNPVNIELVTDPFDDDFADAVRRTAGVADVEGRRAINVRLSAPYGWTTMEIKVLPAFDDLKIGRLVLREGTLSPGDHQALVTTKTAENLGLAIGDELTIELSDGATRQIPVVGMVQDLNTGMSGFLDDTIAYVTLDTLEWLHEAPVWTRLLVTVSERPNDLEYIRAVADEVQDRIERSGRTVYYRRLAAANRHPLDGIIQALLGVFGLLGVLIVFLSGTLIANTLSALLGQHLRQIGVMKLVGARRGQIIGMYLTLILSYGLLALVISVPTASWAAYALSGMVANLINFVLREGHPIPLIPSAILLQVAVALVIPVISGVWPVLRGSRISVQRAIAGADDLSQGQARRGLLDRYLAKVRSGSRPLLISIRNTFRRKGRLALTLATLTLGGAIFIAVFNAQVALDHQVYDMARYFDADVNLDLSRSYRVAEVAALAEQVEGVVKVEAWSSASAEWLGEGDAVVDNISLLAPPADTELVAPVLLAGRWLNAGDENAITINDAFWQDYPTLQVGDRLRLRIEGRDAEWTIVGVFQYTGTDSLIAYTTHDYLARFRHQPDRSAMYRIVAAQHDLATQERMSAEMDSLFRAAGYDVQKVEAGASFAASVTDILKVLTAVLVVLALLTALVGSIGLAGTLSMNVMERTREIGVLRAIGAHNTIVVRMVVVEGLLIGLISYALAAAVSFPITRALTNVISVAIFDSPAKFTVTASGFLIWLAVVVALAVLASIVPARNATRLTIREVLAYE